MNRIQRAHQSHRFTYALRIDNALYQREILTYTLGPLTADLDEAGDLTTQQLIPKNQQAKAKIIAKSNGILAGIVELQYFLNGKWSFRGGKPFGKIQLNIHKKDGDRIKKNDTIVTITGSAADILKVERTILNLIQRMSGIATFTHEYVKKVPSNVLITPTRKTQWGLLDKKACMMGGAGTHRLNLSEAILVKDTHVDLLDHNYKKLFEKLTQGKEHGRFIEIEVETLNNGLKIAELYYQYQKKLPQIPFWLMLDNMQPVQIKKFIVELKKRKLYDHILLEASGGITLKNVTTYAKTGVDALSIGALTHSAPVVDFSLKIII